MKQLAVRFDDRVFATLNSPSFFGGRLRFNELIYDAKGLGFIRYPLPGTGHHQHQRGFFRPLHLRSMALGLAIPALRDIQANQSRFFLIFIVDALTPPTRAVEGHKSLESGEWCDNLVRCRQPPNLEVHLRLTTSIRVEAGTLASLRCLCFQTLC